MNVCELFAAASAGTGISEPGLIVIACAAIAMALFIAYSSGKKMGRGSSVSGEEPVSDNTACLTNPSLSVPDGVSEEVVAAIAAALAAMAPEGTTYTLRSVRRVSHAKGKRPVWAAAGLAESTRPF